MAGRDNGKPLVAPGLQISSISQIFNLALGSENIAPPAPPSVCSLSRNARISNFMVKMKMLLYTVQQVIANMIETLLVKTLHKLNVFTFFSFFVSVSVSPY